MQTIQTLLGLGGNLAFTLAAFLFVLTIVVFFHELGHFLAARWCGVKVQVFSIGFGREIFGFYDKHGTRWRFAWIPLGGYVKFMDDENAASVPSRESIRNMSDDERAGSFHAKPLWQRAFVVAAGPLANFILAIVIFTGLFSLVGQRYTAALVDEISAGSAAEQAGFKVGDRIVRIDGKVIETFGDMQRIVSVNANQTLQFIVERDGRQAALTATPALYEVRRTVLGIKLKMTLFERFLSDAPPQIEQIATGSAAETAGFKVGDRIVEIDEKAIKSSVDLEKVVRGNADRTLKAVLIRQDQKITLPVTPKRDGAVDPSQRRGMLGVKRTAERAHDWDVKTFSPLAAVKQATQETWFIVTTTLNYIKKIIIRQESADQLSGPIGIAKVSGQMAGLGLPFLVQLCAILSVSIGLLNLFPVPMLDGGHLMFYGIEAIRRRPLSERTQEIGFRIGLAMVLMLMIFSTLNDVRSSWPTDLV